MRTLKRVMSAGMIALVIAVFLPAMTNVASAASCNGSYCVYEPSGHSGWGAHGTGSNIDIPYGLTLYHNDELMAIPVFLYVNQSTAIETGVAYGANSVCGWNPYWAPYGTLNNGANEQDLCSDHLAPGSTWQVQAFVTNGTGFSFFNSQYGDPKWAVNWGPYNITGLNLSFSEIHGDGDQPYYNGTVDYDPLTWWDGSNWNYWGYTTTTDDCPYRAQWVSNDYWYSYDEVNC